MILKNEKLGNSPNCKSGQCLIRDWLEITTVNCQEIYTAGVQSMYICFEKTFQLKHHKYGSLLFVGKEIDLVLELI